jgi:hypothetical protein
MSFSNTFETRVLEFVFTGSAVTRPTNWYIGLFTAAPGEAGGGTEVAGNGYARQNPLPLPWLEMLRPIRPALTSLRQLAAWGTVTHTAVFDALTGGQPDCIRGFDHAKAG